MKQLLALIAFVALLSKGHAYEQSTIKNVEQQLLSFSQTSQVYCPSSEWPCLEK